MVEKWWKKLLFHHHLSVFFDLGIFPGVPLQEMLEGSWCKEISWDFGVKMEDPIPEEGGSPWKVPVLGDGARHPAQNASCLIQASPAPEEHPWEMGGWREEVPITPPRSCCLLVWAKCD